ncbi:hypothetical protein [Gordonia polyisoprenivorans]|uniref:hypothetical protein n=1 Tax=Gordonia polyisoprenivorans TaxID=84595 RepID=UPI001AD7776C|nr:hypothetical protein [Gordonia polyisoprenivorans]QTI67270.1 hypothetical protein J6U32_16775 [Gordonia polyisoprenivorans]
MTITLSTRRLSILGAGAVIASAAAPAHADVQVVQKHRTWSDNSVYYEYGPFATSNDCVSFINANDTLRAEWLAGQALCVGDKLPATVWHLQAPTNIL